MNKQKHHMNRRIFQVCEHIDSPVCRNPIQVHADVFLKFHTFCGRGLQKGGKKTPNKETSRHPTLR